jgi:hypothetical protein
MTLSLLFWIVAGATLVIAIWTALKPASAAAAVVKTSGFPLLLLALILILGWRVFGQAVHG